MTKIIQIRGIGEPMTRNMLSGLSRLVPGAEVVELPWAAQYGPVPEPLGQAFRTATAEVPAMLAAELDKGPAYVTMFSGGCVGGGPVVVSGHRNLRGAVFVADPMAPDTGSGYFGVAGSRPLPVRNVLQLNYSRDMIPRCARNSPIRTFSDQTAAFSLGEMDRWAMDMLTRIQRNRWQKVVIPWNNPVATWQLYAEAIAQLRTYLPSPFGDGTVTHVAYGHAQYQPGETFLEHGARWIRTRESIRRARRNL